MNASVRDKRTPSSFSPPIAGMTTAETSAPPFDPSLAESGGGILRKWVAPFAVATALLSAFLTFVVLSGLTPIEPTRHVV